jgi:hypothetical protein
MNRGKADYNFSIEDDINRNEIQGATDLPRLKNSTSPPLPPSPSLFSLTIYSF